jgi:hypothetical protein
MWTETGDARDKGPSLETHSISASRSRPSLWVDVGHDAIAQAPQLYTLMSPVQLTSCASAATIAKANVVRCRRVLYAARERCRPWNCPSGPCSTTLARRSWTRSATRCSEQQKTGLLLNAVALDVAIQLDAEALNAALRVKRTLNRLAASALGFC